MDYKIILSPRSIQDLQEIVRYISFDNPIQAEKFGMLLIDKARVLIAFPEMGRKVPELNDGKIREIIFRSYRIIYRVDATAKTIEISRFWHSARGIPN